MKEASDLCASRPLSCAKSATVSILTICHSFSTKAVHVWKNASTTRNYIHAVQLPTSPLPVEERWERPSFFRSFHHFHYHPKLFHLHLLFASSLLGAFSTFFPALSAAFLTISFPDTLVQSQVSLPSSSFYSSSCLYASSLCFKRHLKRSISPCICFLRFNTQRVLYTLSSISPFSLHDHVRLQNLCCLRWILPCHSPKINSDPFRACLQLTLLSSLYYEMLLISLHDEHLPRFTHCTKPFIHLCNLPYYTRCHGVLPVRHFEHTLKPFITEIDAHCINVNWKVDVTVENVRTISYRSFFASCGVTCACAVVTSCNRTTTSLACESVKHLCFFRSEGLRDVLLAAESWTDTDASQCSREAREISCQNIVGKGCYGTSAGQFGLDGIYTTGYRTKLPELPLLVLGQQVNR